MNTQENQKEPKGHFEALNRAIKDEDVAKVRSLLKESKLSKKVRNQFQILREAVVSKETTPAKVEVVRALGEVISPFSTSPEKGNPSPQPPLT